MRLWLIIASTPLLRHLRPARMYVYLCSCFSCCTYSWWRIMLGKHYRAWVTTVCRLCTGSCSGFLYWMNGYLVWFCWGIYSIHFTVRPCLFGTGGFLGNFENCGVVYFKLEPKKFSKILWNPPMPNNPKLSCRPVSRYKWIWLAGGGVWRLFLLNQPISVARNKLWGTDASCVEIQAIPFVMSKYGCSSACMFVWIWRSVGGGDHT